MHDFFGHGDRAENATSPDEPWTFHSGSPVNPIAGQSPCPSISAPTRIPSPRMFASSVFREISTLLPGLPPPPPPPPLISLTAIGSSVRDQSPPPGIASIHARSPATPAS